MCNPVLTPHKYLAYRERKTFMLVFATTCFIINGVMFSRRLIRPALGIAGGTMIIVQVIFVL
jgi:uncharacterized membrane protein